MTPTGSDLTAVLPSASLMGMSHSVYLKVDPGEFNVKVCPTVTVILEIFSLVPFP